LYTLDGLQWPDLKEFSMRPITLIAVTFMLSCGSSFGTYCEEFVDCLDGNDADEAACVQTWSSERRLAAAYECSEDYAEYSACLLEEAECETNTPNGEDYWTHAADKCVDASDDYIQCLRKASDIIGGPSNEGQEDTGW
jgi:hypothetical protein